jgi:mannitol 2-dehydrogenase
MKLCVENLDALDNRVARPMYHRSQVNVGIVHFGVGGFHRSHQAMYLDRLMNRGLALDWGICGVGVMPGDKVMGDALSGQDGLYTLVLRHGRGRLDARVIGSIVEYLFAPDGPERVLEVLTDPRTRVVSLTITEGGYNIDPVSGKFDTDNPSIKADLVPGAVPSTVFGYVVEALRRRRALGVLPFTVMSCDNIQANGRVARSSILAFAALRDPELAQWIGREVTFPNSMVDRITPTTTAEDIAEVRAEFGIDDAWPVVCEPFTQWALEDRFVNGRPPVEKAGAQVTSDVEPYERMKLRLLNAGHQAIAYSGHLAGHTYAHEAASDPVFAEFLLGYMNDEGRPTLGDVPGVDLDDYTCTLVARFANPAIRDTLARICAFSSDRIPKWVLPVLRENLATGGEITRTTAIVASWARYAEGLDENGRPIEVVDNLRDEVMARAREQSEDPLAFVRNTQLFGDLADNTEFARCYQECLRSFHAVGARRTLQDINTAFRQA